MVEDGLEWVDCVAVACQLSTVAPGPGTSLPFADGSRDPGPGTAGTRSG